MQTHTLGEMETRFADMIWNCAPVTSGELVKLAEKELGWKKSTTYTMLKRLCDRGIFTNQSGTVSVCITKQEFEALQTERFVDKTFGGSLPKFLAAFSTRKKLSEAEIAELQQLISQAKE